MCAIITNGFGLFDCTVEKTRDAFEECRLLGCGAV
jgi:hypothetical protein